jgi:phosphatidylinositol alpha-mannosyltransferase
VRIGMYHCRLPEPDRKPGGVEVFVERLARALGRRGHEVVVHAYAGGSHDDGYTLRHLRPRRAADSALTRQYLASWLLNRTLSSEHDVFHFHGDDWFCFRRPIPTVRTFYGSALLEALSATSVKRRVDQSVVFGLELLARRLATSSYAIGSDSRLLYRADGLLQCGIDPPQGERAPSAAPSILFIGTWSGRKRGELLHRAFTEHVRPQIPDAELWMVADHCEPAPGVTWHRRPDDAQLQALMSRAWTFCLPSSYEGFGIPYLEAMAWGVPVVATPNPGAEDLLRHGDAGLIVEPADLGAALLRTLRDAQLRDRLQAAGTARAADYAWDPICERYEAAYAGAIERWGRRG